MLHKLLSCVSVNMLSHTVVYTLLLTTAIYANPLNVEVESPETRIRGGQNTVIESHPHQVSIGFSGNHDCGGSIIGANSVITAGHCIVYAPQYMTVRAGTSFRAKGGSIHHVESYVRHENFHVNEYNLPVNDIAIIRVKEPFVFDDTRQPIELSSDEVQAGQIAVVTGWGNTGKGYLADQLQSLALPIISKENCDLELKEYGGLGQGQICTKYEGKEKKDACNGDSGGGLTIDGKLVGLISYGDRCDLLEYPGMYTEIAYFYQWILQHL